VTRDEILQLASEVTTFKSRGYVQSARILATWILEVSEPERHELFVENNRLHTRCSELLEEMHKLREENASLRRAEIPTEPKIRQS